MINAETSQEPGLVAQLRACLKGAGRDSGAIPSPNIRQRLKQFLDAARPYFFTGKKQPLEYPGEAKSEVSAFLVSCRRIFWGLAAFSGLSNILISTLASGPSRLRPETNSSGYAE